MLLLLQIKQVLLAARWSLAWPPNLLSHLASPFLNLDNLFSEHLKSERGLLPRHNGGLFSPQGGSLDSQYYTLPVIVCLIIHLLFPPGRRFTVYSYYI